jgi:hypothetical protein
MQSSFCLCTETSIVPSSHRVAFVRTSFKLFVRTCKRRHTYQGRLSYSLSSTWLGSGASTSCTLSTLSATCPETTLRKPPRISGSESARTKQVRTAATAFTFRNSLIWMRTGSHPMTDQGRLQLEALSGKEIGQCSKQIQSICEVLPVCCYIESAFAIDPLYQTLMPFDRR